MAEVSFTPRFSEVLGASGVGSKPFLTVSIEAVETAVNGAGRLAITSLKRGVNEIQPVLITTDGWTVLLLKSNVPMAINSPPYVIRTESASSQDGVCSSGMHKSIP